MKGSIRTIAGFLIVFGAVGGLDHDPTVSIGLMAFIAAIGLAIMYSGVSAMNRDMHG